MIYVDISELASNPLRTGIQRVVRELLKNWHGKSPLCPCIYDSSRDALLLLPSNILSVIRDERVDLGQASTEELALEIARLKAQSNLMRVDPQPGKLLVPELFYDRGRCEFYRKKLSTNPAYAHFIIYDFIPWLEPASIGVTDASPLMRYLLLVQLASSTAFISERTRNDYSQRIRRKSQVAGPIVPLGADGLRLEKQNWSPDRRTYICIGSLDGRRNQHIVTRAFRSLWAKGFDMRLAIYGHTFDTSNAVASEVIAAAECEPLLTHFPRATDSEVMRGLRQARATIYLSSVEGYGLPPVESLHAGIPVVTTDVPSISSIPPHGQIRLSSVEPAQVERSIKHLSDDITACRLWGEAAKLSLPTWRDFAEAVEAWIDCGQSSHQSLARPQQASTFKG